MRNHLACLAMTLLVLTSVLCAASPGPLGYQGFAYVRNPDGGIGPTIRDVVIRFIPESGGSVVVIRTDAKGSYRADLATGRYWCIATHRGFEDYSSIPGFFVVQGGGYQTGNVFLREPRATTVLLLRHAEKASDDEDSPLNPDGRARAQELARVALKAGVTDIYATKFQRTQQTAQPLAEALRLCPTICDDPALLVSKIKSEHNGDTVLVVSHSGTVEIILGNLLGTSVPRFLSNEYDNLFVVTTRGSSGDVVNLQYGNPDTPDSPSNNVAGRTKLLLVTPVESGSAGALRAAALTQAARKANPAAIYCNPPLTTVQPLATALGVTPQTYDAGNVPSFIQSVLSQYNGKTVLICGTRAVLRSIMGTVHGTPVGPLLPNEYDNLVFVTIESPSDAKVGYLQYGAASP